jgi:hypothetical protein
MGLKPLDCSLRLRALDAGRKHLLVDMRQHALDEIDVMLVPIRGMSVLLCKRPL